MTRQVILMIERKSILLVLTSSIVIGSDDQPNGEILRETLASIEEVLTDDVMKLMTYY